MAIKLKHNLSVEELIRVLRENNTYEGEITMPDGTKLGVALLGNNSEVDLKEKLNERKDT